MKKTLTVLFAVAFLSGGYLAFTATGVSSTSSVMASKKNYASTMYIAGMGGHFAKAEITVDPNNAEEPIKVTGLDRVVIGDKTTHPTHDARIDTNDPNTLFWSTYTLDPDKKMHVGKTDLKTGNVILDVALDPDKRAPGEKPPLYCASGQTRKNYMPVFMGSEGFIDIFDKKTLKHKHRMFVSDIGYSLGSYVFVHGINSNDMKKFIISINQKGEDGKANGKVDFILVDLPSLEKGKWKVLKKNTLTGEPGKTITFRQFFSKNDKYIFESAGDRFWLIDAKTLKLVDEKMTVGQNHDAMPTPDGKYAVLTLRTNTEGCDADGKAIPGKTITDGTLQVYDVEARKVIGKPVSVCVDCHKGIGLGDKSAILCGIDGNWKK
ncbi:MAG: hypothetical protein HZB31_04100 [Nitrospirae bacterium]|nr:hypothetical protein [Nitrospirota bacterium]